MKRRTRAPASLFSARDAGILWSRLEESPFLGFPHQKNVTATTFAQVRFQLIGFAERA